MQQYKAIAICCDDRMLNLGLSYKDIEPITLCVLLG